MLRSYIPVLLLVISELSLIFTSNPKSCITGNKMLNSFNINLCQLTEIDLCLGDEDNVDLGRLDKITFVWSYIFILEVTEGGIRKFVTYAKDGTP